MISRLSIIAICLATAALAQISSFPLPSYFRETFARPVTKVELQPPVHLSDFVIEDKEGKKLELSLKSYLDLVMANNTDIAVSRLTVDVAQNAVTRAFAPFDPFATSRFTSTRSKTPASDALQGANTLVTLSQPALFTYNQLLSSGTNYGVSFSATKTSTNSGFQNFNPAINSNLQFNFTQPLIRNRGMYVNRLPIMVAHSRLRATQYALRDLVMQLVDNAENAYWDVALARDNLRVQERALELANEALKRAQRELELGAMSPLDIYQPQQAYATAEISVSQSRYFLLQREDALRKQMGADLDPLFQHMPIVLTETTNVPDTIRNRAAAADLADAVVAKKHDTLMVRGVEQTVRLDVLNAVTQVESSKESVKLARVALDFARKYLDAEQKKYELGTSQIYFVLQAQQSLVNAESALVQNSIAYKRSLLNLVRRTGELLDERGITIQ